MSYIVSPLGGIEQEEILEDPLQGDILVLEDHHRILIVVGGVPLPFFAAARRGGAPVAELLQGP